MWQGRDIGSSNKTMKEEGNSVIFKENTIETVIGYDQDATVE